MARRPILSSNCGHDQQFQLGFLDFKEDGDHHVLLQWLLKCLTNSFGSQCNIGFSGNPVLPSIPSFRCSGGWSFYLDSFIHSLIILQWRCKQTTSLHRHNLLRGFFTAPASITFIQAHTLKLGIAQVPHLPHTPPNLTSGKPPYALTRTITLQSAQSPNILSFCIFLSNPANIKASTSKIVPFQLHFLQCLGDLI